MSNPFTKTIIVDTTHPVVVGEYYQTIGDATQYFITYSIDGGTIIVEAGTYQIASESDTVTIPDNVTLIGRGNAVIVVNSYNASAFKNADQINGNERITISGFKIVVKPSSGTYEKNLIEMKNAKNCVVEKVHISVDQGNSYGIGNNVAAIYLEGEDVTAKEALTLVPSPVKNGRGMPYYLPNQRADTGYHFSNTYPKPQTYTISFIPSETRHTRS